MKNIFLVAVLLFAANSAFSKSISGIRILNSYPMNEAENVHPATGIGITFSDPIRKSSVTIESISVIGTLGGKYYGTVKLSRNGRTVIFTPSMRFLLGDIVQVRLGSFETAGDAMTPVYTLSFSVRKKLAFPDTSFHSDDPVLEHQLHSTLHDAQRTSHGILSLQASPQSYPGINIITENNPSEGNMFLTNFKDVSDQSNTFRMILDKNGEIINAEGGGPDYFGDYKPNPDGTYSFYDYFNGAFFILDSNLTLNNIIGSTYGYVTDAHEIRVTSEGNYYIIAADNEFVDMSQYVKEGFNPATILVPIIQEFDRDSNLIFEWRSTDHFKITDATHEDLKLSYIDFCHINAIEFDADSNLLLSCRHMDEITKIDRKTGEVMWRWGGKNNQFTFIGDTLLFSHQHAIRRTDAGTYLMFDNGNFHTGNAAFSRALEYQLDQKNKIATKIWDFRHNPDVLSLSMGYVQRLPNKNTFIGWGECDDISVTELDPKNQTLYEMGMTGGNYSYRAYKYDTNYVHGKDNSSAAQSIPSVDATLNCIPNPISGQAQIECSVKESSRMNISLFDQLGREVLNIYTGYLSSGKHSYMINSGKLPAGMYFLRAAENNGFTLEKKVVVLK
jgi:hypothetical protein